MMMPFVRLLGIYVVVILLVIAVFNRESVMKIVGFGEAEPAEAAAEVSIEEAGSQVSAAPETPMEVPATDESATIGETALSLTEQLETARQAYWQGNVAEAERLFAELARDYPDQPDIAGELGNLLFAQTRYDEAAYYYEKAARLLLEQGDKARAGALIGTLRAISPNAARELQSLLASAQ